MQIQFQHIHQLLIPFAQALQLHQVFAWDKFLLPNLITAKSLNNVLLLPPARVQVYPLPSSC